MFNKVKYLISIFISLFLILNIGNNISIEFIDAKFLYEKKELFLLMIILFIPIFYLLTLKLVILTQHIKKINLKESFNATMLAYNFNLFLPAKSGDFLRYKFLDLKVNFKTFFKINLLEKIISLIVLFFLVIKSYYLIDLNFSEIFIINKNIILFFSTCLFFFIIYFFFNIKINYKIKKKIYIFCIFDISIWYLQFLQIFLIIKILNININFFETLFIFGTAIIVGLLPISVGGFGVRDFVIYSFLNYLNIESNLFMLLLLFNLRYLLPVFISFIFSILNFINDK